MEDRKAFSEEQKAKLVRYYEIQGAFAGTSAQVGPYINVAKAAMGMSPRMQSELRKLWSS